MKNRTFLKLSPDLLKQELTNDLDVQSLINFTLINRRAHSLLKPTSLAYQYLKKFVERSAKKQVSTMLTNAPSFNITFNHLQDAVHSALMLGDIDLVKVITKGREDEFKQIAFPTKLVDETNTYDFSAVVAAIKSGKDVEKVLAKYRRDLDKIVKEKGFPFQALLDALEIYNEKFDKLTYGESRIFSINVIGYLQRLSPAWLKKASWGYGGNTFIPESIDPSRQVPNKGLGFDFCVGKPGHGSPLPPGCIVAAVATLYYETGSVLETFLEQNQQSLANYANDIQARQEKSSECKCST